MTRQITEVITAKLVELHAGEPERLVRALTILNRFLSRVRETVTVAWRDDREDAAAATKRSLEKLRAELDADRKFRMLLEDAPDPCIIVDTDARIVLLNRQFERVFGYTRQEMLGQPVDVLVPERLRAEHRAYMAAYFAAPDVRRMHTAEPLHGLRKDGTELPIEVSLSPIVTDDGLLVSSSIRDVTERVLGEAALRRMNRELEAFSYSAAHDLRTPLRGMAGFAKILLEECADKLEPEHRRHLQHICDNAIRMGATIDALLELARVSRTEPSPVAVDISALSAELLAALREASPERTVEVRIAPAIVIPMDPTLARTLLANLLENAWKFTTQTRHATIEVGRMPDGFFVRDNGSGFDMQYADKLFVPFQRLLASKEYPGTGIGLATAHRILDRHGGRIWAQAAPGEGATFYLSLPGALQGVQS